MNAKTWTAVDGYIVSSLFDSDPALDAVLTANREQGLPAIDVSPAQGKLLSKSARSAAIRPSGWQGACLPTARS